MKRLALALIITCLCSLPVLADGDTTDVFSQAQGYVLESSHGWGIHAWLNRPDHGEEAPLIVLLHGFGEDHTAWRTFIEDVREYVRNSDDDDIIMPYILTLDAPGSGASNLYNRSHFAAEDMRKPHWEKVPHIITDVMDTVIADPANKIIEDRITLIGASVLANAVMMIPNFRLGIEKIVMISPSENYRGMAILEPVQRFRGDILIVMAERDHHPRKTTEAILEKYRGRTIDYKLYPGRGHGLPLLEKEPGRWEFLVDWVFTGDPVHTPIGRRP